MAEAYPQSTVPRLRLPRRVDRARPRTLAAAEGVDGRTEFARASAKDYPGEGYDLVCFFDCLHDMGDPVGALQHVRETLDPDGTVMLVEPFADDSLDGQPEPGRPHLLRGIDADLHPLLARPGGWPRPRRAGRRAEARGGGRGSRLQSLPACHPDAVQPGSRGTTVGRPCPSSSPTRRLPRVRQLAAGPPHARSEGVRDQPGRARARRGHSRARRDRPRPGGGVLRRRRHADAWSSTPRTTRRPRGRFARLDPDAQPHGAQRRRRARPSVLIASAPRSSGYEPMEWA